MEQSSQAVEGPLQRSVGAHEPERAAFEVWATREDYDTRKVPGGVGTDGRCVYADTRTHAAWWAWQEARPKRPAVGAAMNVASMLAQRKPLDAFGELEDATHIGHRQFRRAYNKADEDTRLLAVKLADALRAL